MAFFGVDMQVRVDELTHEFKNTLRAKGTSIAGMK